MKRILKITGYLSIVSSLIFTSCLKDDSLTLNTSLSNSVTEFANTGSIATNPSNGAAPRYSIDLGSLAVGDQTSFNINVDYAGAETAPKDITVTVDVDPTILSTYNTEHAVDGANYIMPDAGIILTNFPMTITIPKGQTYGQAVVDVQRTADYNFSASYALPLKITSTSVGDISGNFGTAMYSINIRNSYDGMFAVTGSMYYSPAPSYTGSYPKTIYLVTQDATSNAYFDPNLNGGFYGYLFNANGSGSYFGTFDPVFHFDADGNVTSVTNYPPYLPNSRNRDAALDPSGVNKMTFENGVPKTMDVSYFMTQGGPVVLSVTEHFEYIGPRP
ncbi:MAG: DUF1735 domain-containing protein [Bacteroidetes bacterium]|nr:DUF1735 domain-containing protein [Bacteroidota bacterium]